MGGEDFHQAFVVHSKILQSSYHPQSLVGFLCDENKDKDNLDNIDIDKAILESINIDLKKDILETINIDKDILEDINKDFYIKY